MRTVVNFKKALLLSVIMGFSVHSYALKGDSVTYNPKFSMVPFLAYNYTFNNDGVSSDDTNFCGGALMNGGYIITALHCLNKQQFKPGLTRYLSWTINKYKITLPKSNTGSSYEINYILPYYAAKYYDIDDYDKLELLDKIHEKNIGIYEVEKVYLPPLNKYDRLPDVAILKLAPGYPHPDHLPNEVADDTSTSCEDIPAGFTGMGWSSSEAKSYWEGPELQHDTHDFGILREEYTEGLKKAFEYGEQRFDDYCQSNLIVYPGDSGSPLMKYDYINPFKLYGVVSFGSHERSDGGYLGNYLMLGHYKDSINNILRTGYDSAWTECEVGKLCTVGSSQASKRIKKRPAKKAQTTRNFQVVPL